MKLLVLDGNSIVNRAFYGIKQLSTREGLPTNGIYGFLTTLQRMEEESAPDGVAIAFDLRAPTFRHRAYPAYKANRKGMPEELAQQMPLLKELLAALGYAIVTCEGYEADDILGTLARACREQGWECVLATGDRDSLQLVAPGVSVRLASTKLGQPQVTLYDEEKIREEYGVSPRQLIDIKALMGDSSDNIPGVRGIGPKGAGELIQGCGSLSYLYEHLEELELKPAMRQKLMEGRESAFLSYELGEICTTAPIDTTLSHYTVGEGDKGEAARLMTRLELFSLMKKRGISPAASESAPQGSSIPAQACRDVPGLLLALAQQEAAYVLPVYAQAQLRFLLVHGGERLFAVDCRAHTAFLQDLFSCADILKYTKDLKPLYAALEQQGIVCRGMAMDTLLAAYLLNPSSADYEPERLAQEYSLPPCPSPERQEGLAPEISDEMLRQLSQLPMLCERLREEIAKNQQEELLHNMEIPLAQVLAHMEEVGFAVDAPGIRDYGEKLGAQIGQLEADIHQQVGYTFNVNSPKQLGAALFEKLGLPTGKKTKSGYSTNAEVLEGLRYAHPVVESILEYRTLAKLKSTYCDGLLKAIAPDGRIHSSFNQTETRTGRISSAEPNLQNIPVRTEVGRELRRFFVAREGCLLVDADYSQIELRVLAHVSGDRNMQQAFRENRDIHRATASQVFHIPEEMVTPLMRSRAKAVNFGIVYGIGAFSLSKDLGVTRREAEDYIEAYLSYYSGVRRYMEQVVELAKEQGYVETIFGRRRYLPELSSSNFNLRSFGQRVARNMPIQGAAADIIKIAMIQVENRLREEGLAARLILQVHDELIVEAPEQEAAQVAQLLSEEMQAAVSLSVPMLADSQIGKTWYDAKS